MAGINLSQSGQNKKETEKAVPSSGKSFFWIFIIFLLVAGTWGAMVWYIHSLNQKIADAETTLENNATNLRGPTVDRVADFDKRLTVINTGLEVPIEPKDELETMERLMVPEVTLFQYQFDNKTRAVTLQGLTDSLKYVAQQIQSLRSDPGFSEVRANSIQVTKEGKIAFTLKAFLQ